MERANDIGGIGLGLRGHDTGLHDTGLRDYRIRITGFGLPDYRDMIRIPHIDPSAPACGLRPRLPGRTLRPTFISTIAMKSGAPSRLT